MSTDTIIKPDKETKAETKPGNYFVSNYPPFSFWKEDEVPCVESMLGSPFPGTALWVSTIMFRFAESVVTSAISVSTLIKTLMTFADTSTPPFVNWKRMRILHT